MPPSVTRPEPALSIVVPVYNEAGSIERALKGLLDSVRTRPLEILVVYDFDGDDTLPVVQRLLPEMPEVRLTRNDLGQGVLNALRAGLRSARAPFVVTTMADLSDDPDQIDTMLTAARGGADLVVASRYMRGGRQVGGPLVKCLLSRLAGLSLCWAAGLATHDATNSFKLFSRRLLDSVRIESTAGFALGLELTVKAHLAGCSIIEVPTTWRDRTAGESRFRLRAWIPHYLRWYLLAMADRITLRRRGHGLDR